ncbi:MAG: hypothetical protein ABI583_12120 [Betaproteobacteria bacterium]
MFSQYVLSRLTLWFDKYVMFDTEREYARTHKVLRTAILLMTGSYETLKPGSKNKRFNSRADKMLDMNSFKRQLKSRRYPGLTIRSEMIADEVHLTVAPAAMTRGLMWAFGKSEK